MQNFQGKKDKIVLYMQAGSGNHGCEAIANTVIKMLSKPAILMTNSAAEDGKYSLNGMCTIIEEKKVRDNFFVHVWFYLKEHLLHDADAAYRYRFGAVSGKNLHQLNISIGGDNYCYDLLLKELRLSNKLFTDQGAKTMLLGCSIEPELLDRPDIVEDLNRYSCIVARESITMQALEKAGLGAKSFLVPDSAFLLNTEKLPLPKGFQEGNTLGLNVSPMVVEREKSAGITMENYRELIRYVLKNTDMSIALIPHVIWKHNDDRSVLNILYQEFKESGRVVLIKDCSCEQLKGYISRCRFFIGARTHATIAAYSSLIPTLVLGYSVKARGIAQDLFGTWENYVVPVQSLERKEELAEKFDWLLGEELQMRTALTAVMPGYQERARQADEIIDRQISACRISSCMIYRVLNAVSENICFIRQWHL